MNLKHLRYFISVADNLSFTKASKKLFVSQPTLSYAINFLEEELDVRLFIRKHHSLKLSTAGEKLYDLAIKIIALVDKIYTEIKPILLDNRTLLRIGFMGDLLPMIFLNIMASFLLKNPEIKTQLEQKGVLELHEALSKDMFDIIITRSSALEDIPVRDSSALVLSKDEFCIVVPENTELAKREALSDLSVLKNEIFIALSSERTSPLLGKINRICNARNYYPTIELTDYTLDSVLAKVSSGAGITITPKSYVYFKQYPHVKVINILPSKGVENNIVACFKTKNTNPSLKIFIEYLNDLAQ
ncbi:MAG: LysR family transcriptional regulator [Saccharofermentanales bacterium]